eukprot:3274484-Pyramimonas_sp.AAC.2
MEFSESSNLRQRFPRIMRLQVVRGTFKGRANYTPHATRERRSLRGATPTVASTLDAQHAFSRYCGCLSYRGAGVYRVVEIKVLDIVGSSFQPAPRTLASE